ncbi:hypothetical protein AK88_05047 [Plasmodium fragile]|uniref:Uncharacterized protein n=1 Tax=Plasmodium fragile TaxID=5857 RepID=A0A0D9QEA6_PLAFR|nr:uncharacterized protein AK88_05047 [Plasmodium fragile]KJP85314.1 hypothetical protein AK88_05047 [Plasmodium fragile]
MQAGTPAAPSPAAATAPAAQQQHSGVIAGTSSADHTTGSNDTAENKGEPDFWGQWDHWDRQWDYEKNTWIPKKDESESLPSGHQSGTEGSGNNLPQDTQVASEGATTPKGATNAELEEHGKTGQTTDNDSPGNGGQTDAIVDGGNDDPPPLNPPKPNPNPNQSGSSGSGGGSTGDASAGSTEQSAAGGSAQPAGGGGGGGGSSSSSASEPSSPGSNGAQNPGSSDPDSTDHGTGSTGSAVAEGARDKGEQGHGGADGAQNGKGTDTRSASNEKDKNSSHGGGATGSRGTSPDIWDEDLSEKDLWGIGKVPPSGELGDVPDDADLWGIGKASSKVSTTTPSATTNDVSKSSDTAPSEPTTTQHGALELLDMSKEPPANFIDKDEEVLPEIEYLENEEPNFMEETDPSSSQDGDDEANADGSELDDATLDKVLEEEQLDDDVNDNDEDEDEAELHTPVEGGQSDTNASTPSGPSPSDPSTAATQQETERNADSSVSNSTPSTPPSASQKPQQPFTDKNAHALLAGNTNNTIDLKKTTQQLTQQILSTIQGDTQFLDTLKDLTKDLSNIFF